MSTGRDSGMVYAGKHARQASDKDSGDELPSGAALDSLEYEESQDSDGSHAHMQQLLGSIHLQGIRLQSPIYIEGLKTKNPAEPSSADHGAGLSEPEEFLRDDTVILEAVEKPPWPYPAVPPEQAW